MRLSRKKPVRWLSAPTSPCSAPPPCLVQLSIIYYGLFYAISLPRLTLFGFVDISRFIPGVVALALNSSAYVAEFSVPVFWPWIRGKRRPPALWVSPNGRVCVWWCCRRR